MLFYLTGMATERCATWAYGRLRQGLMRMGEEAAARTVVTPISRQEPGHFAYYRLAAEQLGATLAPWQREVLRRVRAHTFAPVGVGDSTQSAQFGQVIDQLDGEPGIPAMTTSIVRLEQDVLGCHAAGVPVPDYALRAFRQAVERARS